MTNVTPIPPGFNTISAHIIVRNAAEAIEFYKRAFSAVEEQRHKDPSGKIMNADLRIGNSMLILCDEYPEWGAVSPLTTGSSASVTLHLYTEDADSLFAQAVEAGAQVKMPLSDAFWGDRYGQITDPYGHSWSIATRKKIFSETELEAAMTQAFAKECGK